MPIKTKLIIAAAVLAGTTSLAAAQGFDPNMANRYPAYADPVAPGAQRTAPVGLPQNRSVHRSHHRHEAIR